MEENVLDVEYVGSYQDVAQCPPYQIPEYCFIGRSNVGKSSVINLITGRQEIARTSKKPGKTQSINLFTVKEQTTWIIADLPGYGFAAVSQKQRAQWKNMIEKYITQRENLMTTFLLVDIRHARQENDRLFMNYLGENHIPFCILFTKSDKLKPAELDKSLDAYKSAILTEWEELPKHIVTSSFTKKGREEVLDYIHQLNNTFAATSK